jgi:hypothetical protein
METPLQDRLISYLQEDLAVPSSAIALALRRQEASASLLPMILWQYGLISLEQLNQVFDWLETA